MNKSIQQTFAILKTSNFQEDKIPEFTSYYHNVYYIITTSYLIFMPKTANFITSILHHTYINEKNHYYIIEKNRLKSHHLDFAADSVFWGGAKHDWFARNPKLFQNRLQGGASKLGL